MKVEYNKTPKLSGHVPVRTVSAVRQKQGSSENDGRSDVYDRSEFKVITPTAGIPTAVAPIAVILPVFT